MLLQQIHLPQFNAQAPTKIVYPANFVTAKAYVDQLVRSNALTAAKGTELNDGDGQEEHQGAEDVCGEP